MKAKQTHRLLCALLSFSLLAGCAEQRYRRYRSPASTEAGYVTGSTREHGTGYTTIEQAGGRFHKASMAFPSGRRESSGLLVEKLVPVEILIGQPFEYEYRIMNLTDSPLQAVTLFDRVSTNFTAADAVPRAVETREGLATWHLGSLGPKETKVVRVKGLSRQEGLVSTCGWATYTPMLCQEIKVVRANIQLLNSAPVSVAICDAIPITVTVKNTGSSDLSNLIVTDRLPAGLASNGKTNVIFDLARLPAGESKEFRFSATASSMGRYVSSARVTSAQGATAEATVTTTVHEPILNFTCKAPEEQFLGRAFDVCYTVVNRGDAPAVGTVIEVPIPTGLSLRSATSAGHGAGRRLVWELGTLQVDSPTNVCATFVSIGPGQIQFEATAKGVCARAVSAICQTRVLGVAAILLEKADDPDPIGVGETTTYTIKITNQGTADDSNVRLVAQIPAELAPVNASGGGAIDGQTVTFPPVPRLAPKESTTYTIVARGVKAGDAHTRFVLNSDVLKSAISAEESTHIY